MIDLRRRSGDALRVPILLGVICVLIFAEQAAIARINDWWVDELFALWASDRDSSFWELFRTRIVTDSNPPLFFSLLHFFRLVISNDRAAVLALNVSIVASGATLVLAAAWRSRYRSWVAITVALFALGGPLAAYLPEARSYCLAMTASYVAVMLAGLYVSEAYRPRSLIIFAIVGVLAGLSHLFAALLCCALATGMLAINYPLRNHEQRLAAFALGGSATAATASWMFMWWWLGPGSLGQVSWIPFTAASVQEAGFGALSIAHGSAWITAGFGIIMGVALLDRRSRRLATLVAIAIGLFVVVPVIISFHVPVIISRYWLVGTPLFTAPLVLFIGRWSFGLRRAAFATAATSALVLVSLPLSFEKALGLVIAKPMWRGVTIVKEQLETCGPKSIHVLGFTPGFSLMTGAPPSTFVDVRGLEESTRSETDTCPILGWSEHYVLRFGPDYLAKATADELLRLLKLAYSPEEVVIARHDSGYVVRRR
jgi:hypothetical protein